MRGVWRASIAAVLFVSSWCAAVGGEDVPNSIKPNVVYILAAEVGYGDLGCYGQDSFQTPNIDRLAAEGMRFAQHYAGGTSGAVASCCLLTGKHSGHATVRGDRGVPLRAEDLTVAELLQRAGYTTACIGRWGLGFGESTGAPWRQGFDYFCGYLNSPNRYAPGPPELWRNDEKVAISESDPKTGGSLKGNDLFTEEALAFIERSAEQPFFLYLAYARPEGMGGSSRSAYADMISRIDRDTGRIVEQLARLGLDARTLVMFSSAGGPSPKDAPAVGFFKSTGSLRGMQGDLYEGGIRTPLIARWPGSVPAGATSDFPAAHWDLLPTAAALAGVYAPPRIDGVSVLPTLLGRAEEQKSRPYFYWECFEQGGKQAIRAGQWKAVRVNVFDRPDGAIALYDLSSDLGETTDIAADKASVVDKLAEGMRRARSDSPYFRFRAPRIVGGELVPRDAWRVAHVDSESGRSDEAGSQAFDGDPRTFWHTARKEGAPPHPHEVVVDMGASYAVSGFRYLPRVDGDMGTIREYAFFVSDDPNDWGMAAAQDSFDAQIREKQVDFPRRSGRFFRLQAMSCQAGSPFTSCAELNVLRASPTP